MVRMSDLDGAAAKPGGEAEPGGAANRVAQRNQVTKHSGCRSLIGFQSREYHAQYAKAEAERQLERAKSDAQEKKNSLESLLDKSMSEAKRLKSNLDQQLVFSDKVKAMLNMSSCDVTLETSDGGKVSAHRCVLAAWSPVFAKMFSSGFQESKENSILIHDIDCPTVERLLEYMYTGRVKIEDATLQESKLLATADKYEVLELVRFLDSGLCSYLKDDTVFEFWRAAVMHNAPLLKEASITYIISRMNRGATAKILKGQILSDNRQEREMAAELVEKWLGSGDTDGETTLNVEKGGTELGETDVKCGARRVLHSHLWGI
ncbi:unnamed protein product [Closterium sp. Yama58-4]|nr:unnamed protein product [Closterium sp. Yama58-4]